MKDIGKGGVQREHIERNSRYKAGYRQESGGVMRNIEMGMDNTGRVVGDIEMG